MTYHLPSIDRVYENQHINDKPLMLYPGEVASDEIEGKRYKYIITNYGRIYNIERNSYIKNITGIQLTTFMKEHFTPEQLDNEYTRTNLNNTPNKLYYQRNKADVIARQQAYNALHKEHKREYDKNRRIMLKQQQQQNK